MHISQEAKLFDHNTRGQATRADQFEESADDAMCQRMQWIALQMAQQDTEWLKGELQHSKQKIKAKEQQLLEARKAKTSSEVIALIKDRKDRLVDKKMVLRSTLQARLASPSGEVLAAALVQ